MSVRSFIGGTIRGLVIATVAAGAAFGALVVFEPFKPASPAPAATSAPPASIALQQRIEALRVSLRDAEQALDAAQIAPSPALGPDAASRAQYEAQIAAAIERRDLARRHADAIRKSLEAGVTPSSLAAIRDSVVIGQLLGQQAALDTQIAIEGARLRPNHPTMRGLTAQRTALATQIRAEAASIAAALESEARIDEAQIELLEAQLSALAVTAPEASPDRASLAAQAAAQRAELDSLVDAYFNIPPATAVAPNPARNLLSLPNILVVAVAALAALLFQLLLAVRRGRAARAADVAAWRADYDPETGPAVATEVERKAA